MEATKRSAPIGLNFDSAPNNAKRGNGEFRKTWL